MAKHLCCPDFVLQVYCSAVETLAVGPVVALRGFNLHLFGFLGIFFRSDCNTVEALSSRRVVAFGSNITIPASEVVYSISLALIPVCKGYFLGFLELTIRMAPSTK